MGMRRIICHSLLFSIRPFASENIIPGKISPSCLARLSSYSLVQRVCCSSKRIWSTMVHASAAIGERFSRKTRSEYCQTVISSLPYCTCHQPLLCFFSCATRESLPRRYFWINWSSRRGTSLACSHALSSVVDRRAMFGT